MNQKSNKLTVPDLISVGVFTALYFVLVTVATLCVHCCRAWATFCCPPWPR